MKQASRTPARQQPHAIAVQGRRSVRDFSASFSYFHLIAVIVPIRK
jgi:hypothetical protein